MNCKLTMTGLILGSLLVQAAPARAAAPSPYLQTLKDNWELREPRRANPVSGFFKHIGSTVVDSNIVHSVVSLGQAVGDMFDFNSNFSDNLTRAGYKVAESPLNILQFINGAGSDAISLAEAGGYAGFPTSQRIQVCTMNLSATLFDSNTLRADYFFDPAKHVGALIDGVHSTHDPGGGDILDALGQGGLVCKPAPMVAGETETVSVQRLICMSNLASGGDYTWFGNNCGAYTRNLMRSSGLGFPGAPNVGLGSAFQIGLSDDEKNSIAEDFSEASKTCDEVINDERSAILSFERGADLSPQSTSDLSAKLQNYGGAFYTEAEMQMVISAARGKNAVDRKFLVDHLTSVSVPTLDDSHLSAYHQMFDGLDDEAKQWIQANFAQVYGFNYPDAGVQPALN